MWKFGVGTTYKAEAQPGDQKLRTKSKLLATYKTSNPWLIPDQSVILIQIGTTCTWEQASSESQAGWGILHRNGFCAWDFTT